MSKETGQRASLEQVRKEAQVQIEELRQSLTLAELSLNEHFSRLVPPSTVESHHGRPADTNQQQVQIKSKQRGPSLSLSSLLLRLILSSYPRLLVLLFSSCSFVRWSSVLAVSPFSTFLYLPFLCLSLFSLFFRTRKRSNLEPQRGASGVQKHAQHSTQRSTLTDKIPFIVHSKLSVTLLGYTHVHPWVAENNLQKNRHIQMFKN